MSADLGLWHGTSPSTSTMQVRSLQAYAVLPKLDGSSWASRACNQDKICKSGQLKWQREN